MRQYNYGFWPSLNAISMGKTVMVLWQSMFGKDFPAIQPFLQPTLQHSFTYPCTFEPWCECHHEVSEDPEWEQVGVCVCGDCQPIPLKRQDTILYTINRQTFGEALRRALGFAPGSAPPCAPNLRPSTPFEIGVYAPLHAPVYFHAPTNADGLLADIHATLTDRPGPFLWLTPTMNSFTPAVDTVLQRAGCAHAALSPILDPHSLHPALASQPSTLNHLSRRSQTKADQLSTVLNAWSARVTSQRQNSNTLLSIHREIDAVRKDYVQLRTAKQRLEQMLTDGMFAFSRKVDTTSFKILCAVLAEGDIAKAARALDMGDPLIRKTLRKWRSKGPAYLAMLDLVRWRKQVGRKGNVPLHDSILLGQAQATDYPGLLSDILDGLLSMTEDNWQDLCEELATSLRPAIAAGTPPGPAGKTPIRGS
jgi:hypothetical protein